VRRTLADRRGMTVGEVLLAVAILGVALAGLAGAIPAAAFAIQDGKQMSTAVFLAEERLDRKSVV